MSRPSSNFNPRISELDEEAVIVSITSDIGAAIAERWLSRGINVRGTYRTESKVLHRLNLEADALVHCDLLSDESVESAVSSLRQGKWGRLVMSAGTQEPIGLFSETSFDEWAASLKANLVSQLRIVHGLLPHAFPEGRARVLFFAGGATNRATVRYSAYTISKIASIKMVELLAAEYPGIGFTILGPGWVRTKIHQATISNPFSAAENYELTRQKFRDNDFFPMDELMRIVDWIFESELDLVSGRNFSAVHDEFWSSELIERLRVDHDFYKLRRNGNEWRPENTQVEG